jgi:putative transposase
LIERRRRWFKRYRPNAKNSQIIQRIRIDCEEDGTHVASHNTIRARLKGVSLRQDYAEKYGAKFARQKFGVIEGKTPPTTYPLERIQIDHTLVDVVCVSEYEREFVGRPWITIAIDEHTEVLIVSNNAGQLAARPLLEKSLDAATPNAIRHLIQLKRVEVATALMAETVLVPEGSLDYEWLSLLARVVELQADPTTAGATFSSTVGIVPTQSSAVAETAMRMALAHTRVVALVDGDAAPSP